MIWLHYDEDLYESYTNNNYDISIYIYIKLYQDIIPHHSFYHVQIKMPTMIVPERNLVKVPHT